MRISANGGVATVVTTLAEESGSLLFPHFLPDGRRFLFLFQGPQGFAGIYLGDLEGSAPVRLAPGLNAAVFHPDGWLLWLQEGTLTAQRLDLAQAVLTGEPRALADGIAGRASVSSTGLVAYRSERSASRRQLTWVDRAGTVLGILGEPDSALSSPRVSADGSRVAVTRDVEDNGDIWLLDGARRSRFTFAGYYEGYHIWSPDGTQILFRPDGKDFGDLYLKPSSGAGTETLFINTGQLSTPTDWSADGRFVLYFSLSTETARDLWAVPTTGERTPFLVLQTRFNEVLGQFSPDGRWVAYQSDESGRDEVYVRAFVAPDAGNAAVASGQWQISTAGGGHPLWSPDGQELYYLDPQGNMMVVPLITAADSVEAGIPEQLFTRSTHGWGMEFLGTGRQHDIAPDGRFLLNVFTNESASAPITLLQNWNPEE